MASSSDLTARASAPPPVPASTALSSTWPRRAATAFNALVHGFVRCPLVFVVWLSFFKDAILTFPPSGLVFRRFAPAQTFRALKIRPRHPDASPHVDAYSDALDATLRNVPHAVEAAVAR